MNKHEQLIEDLSRTFAQMKRMAMQTRDQLLGELQLTRTQIEIIMFLHERDGQTIGELAILLGVTQSAATQTAETLVKRDLLDRRADSVDRRVVRMHLTPRALELAGRLTALRRARMTAACADIPDDELAIMISVLKRVTKKFQESPHVK